LQGDAIRNIAGGFSAVRKGNIAGKETAGAFTKTNFNAFVGAGQNGDDWGGNYNFDASRVVPTADENRPKNLGMTPAIYLGV